MKATLLLTQLLCAALTAVAVNDVPRIVSVQLHDSELFLAVELPPGIERVSLESCRRHNLSGWVPRASQSVNGAAKIKMVVSVTGAEMEIFRLRVERDDPLPAAFYAGETDFRPERLGQPSVAVGDTLQAAALGAVDSACVFVIPGTGGDVPVMPNDSVARVIPVGDWLIKFSGTEVLVSAVDAPEVVVRRYALDALQVLGAVREGGKIHVLQGRAASHFNGIFLFDVTGASPDSQGGLLQHTIIDTDNLPELMVVGTASMETTNTASLVDAKAVWPEPGLLVWSLNQEQGFMIYNFPILTLTTGFGIRLDFAQSITWGPVYSPLAWLQTRVAGSLVAVDVNDVESPRVVSETVIPRGASTMSEAYGARGLVLYSHANDESELVATNSVLETNYIQVTVTNLVQRTNFIAEPVIVIETNAAPTALVSASKLPWHEPLSGSQFAGGSSHSLGLEGNGTVLAWGQNRCGEVNGGSWPVMEPATVPGPSSIVRIAAGDWQSLAVTAEGVVWQWGSPDGPMPPWPGQPPKQLFGPSIVPLPGSVVNVSAGGSHAMAIASDGRLWTWGRNYYGVLGRDGPESEPLLVQGDFAAVSAGWMHSLALTRSGAVYSWGWNEYGQLGQNGAADRPGRVELPEGIRFRAVSAGAVHSLALAEDGVVWRWGDTLGAPLSGGGLAEPNPIDGLPPIHEIVSGSGHSLALAENGEVWFLGDDGATPFTLARVDSLTNVIEIGTGTMHSFALTAEGDLFIWGRDLPVISSRGEVTQLSFTSSFPLIETRTNYVIVTNMVAELQATEQSQAVVVTNTTPVYEHLRRHWLDVVDYRQDPLRPVVREPVSLPGSLQGISHGGALLYTRDGSPGDSPFGLGETSLSALAYDGISAHRIDTILLVTNSVASTVPIAVHPSGWVVVARDLWPFEHAIECWRLTGQGQLERVGQVALSASSEALVLIDDLAVVRVPTGFALIDLADPSAPAALPVEMRGQSGAIQRVAGNRQSGLWVPVGGLGTLPLWHP